MPKTDPPTIEDHIISTYKVLRVGIGLLAFALPLILSIIGLYKYGLSLQDSISAYYHAYTSSSPGFDPFLEAGKGHMRNWFVGILWAIGVFLILYRGYGRRENVALNIAGILLICVAMFPMDWTCRDACSNVSIHGVSAVIFFIAIGYVCIFRSGDTLGDTLKLSLDDTSRTSYQRAYRIIGFVMWGFPVLVVVLNFFHLYVFGRYTVFIIETAGIWTFASYWLLKSREIAGSKIDRVALSGNLERAPRKPGVLKYWFDTAPHIQK
jgi:hypothetical protein